MQHVVTFCFPILKLTKYSFYQRNLRIMANLGLSARQEKDDRLQKTKQEVAEMVRQRVQYMKSKVCVLLVYTLIAIVVHRPLVLKNCHFPI